MKTTLRETALDTCILIDHFKADLSIEKRLSGIDMLLIPVPVIAEMEFGYQKLRNPAPGRRRFHEFLAGDGVEIIVCDRRAAERFAEIKNHLRENGNMIPVNDIWIAACCVAHGKTLATRDADFKRVPNLNIEMW